MSVLSKAKHRCWLFCWGCDCSLVLSVFSAVVARAPLRPMDSHVCPLAWLGVGMRCLGRFKVFPWAIKKVALPNIQILTNPPLLMFPKHGRHGYKDIQNSAVSELPEISGSNASSCFQFSLLHALAPRFWRWWSKLGRLSPINQCTVVNSPCSPRVNHLFTIITPDCCISTILIYEPVAIVALTLGLTTSGDDTSREHYQKSWHSRPKPQLLRAAATARRGPSFGGAVFA